MTRLLVSVRSATEAVAALAGGADVIDVKEPANGPLGRADSQTLAEIVRTVGRQRPVSAAMGEWRDLHSREALPSDVAYLKWGFSNGCTEELTEVAACFDGLRIEKPERGLVTVAYADWERAAAPTPDELVRFACAGCWGPLLIDTWKKDGSTLLDWLPLFALRELTQHCQAARVPVALAGSLGFQEILTLLPLRPDWLGVRGAVCVDRDRTGQVDEEKVRCLADWIATYRLAATRSGVRETTPES